MKLQNGWNNYQTIQFTEKCLELQSKVFPAKGEYDCKTSA